MTSRPRDWIVVAAAVAMSGTAACTTRVVDFAGRDAGSRQEQPPAPVADAPPADLPGEAAPPDVAIVTPRELTPPAEDPFLTQPRVDGPSLYVEYKCCNDGGSICSIWAQGDGVTCRDTATWTIAATRDCGSRGFNAVEIGLFGACQ